MNRFAVRQQDDSQIPSAGLGDLAPAPNPAVSLKLLPQGSVPRPLDPRVLDCRAVGPSLHRGEVGSRLHAVIRSAPHVFAGGANQLKFVSDYRAPAMIGEALPTQAICPEPIHLPRFAQLAACSAISRSARLVMHLSLLDQIGLAAANEPGAFQGQSASAPFVC